VLYSKDRLHFSPLETKPIAPRAHEIPNVLYGLAIPLCIVNHLNIMELNNCRNSTGDEAPKPPLYGIYDAETFVKKAIHQATTDTTLETY